jgi:transaldolase
MKLFLDTGELAEVKQGVDWGVVDGVTTNPTLIARAGNDHESQIKKICGIVGNVSAECVSVRADDLIVEGRRIASWHPNVIVKVPLTPDGLSAGKVLAGEGIRINVTLCFSVNQALLAASIGAHIVSPFVGRLEDINEDGVTVVRDIVNAYRQQGITTKVLAASLRGPAHVTQSALAGADIGTMPFKVLASMFHHPLTDIGLAKFAEDYRKAAPHAAAHVARQGSATAAATATRSDELPDEAFADRLWGDHTALGSELARLQTVADALGGEPLPPDTLRAVLDRVHDLLAGKVLPHIRTADEYQRRLAGQDGRGVSDTDCDAADRLAGRLGALRDRVASDDTAGVPREIRRLLYELNVLTRPHFADQGQARP